MVRASTRPATRTASSASRRAARSRAPALLAASAGGAGALGVADNVADVRSVADGLAQQGRSLGALQSEQRQLVARLDGLDALASGWTKGLDQGLSLVDGRLQAMQVRAFGWSEAFLCQSFGLPEPPLELVSPSLKVRSCPG